MVLPMTQLSLVPAGGTGGQSMTALEEEGNAGESWAWIKHAAAAAAAA